MKRKTCILAALLLGVLLLPAAASAPENSAASAVLIDCDSRRILYEKNADERRLIASITKLMTALVAVECCDSLQTAVTILPEWTGAEGSSLYLKAGEVWQLETLLYGLLLHSGNDAAVAIAGFCAGEPARFVDWMNERAKDLGMASSHFENPNGLNHEEHYSSARDMATLAAYCMQNETLAKIVATKSVSIEGRSFTNHNKLLWQYEGCVGMKTGYTQLAGRTLISSAKRNGQTLALVTLSDPNDWSDHAALLDYGFETYPRTVFLEAGALFDFIPVEGSFTRSVSLILADEIAYPLSEDERGRAELAVFAPEFAAAPLLEAGIAGRVALILDGAELCSSYLLYGKNITRDSLVANEQIQRFLDLSRGETQRVYDLFSAQRP